MQNKKTEATPSLPQQALIFNPQGQKMKPFFHVMISYRVSTEKNRARVLFDRLLQNSFKRIPEVGMSKWPEGFSDQKYRSGHANVFLDQVCLKSGENWEQSDEGGGFVGALLKSLIFVPLLSWKVETDASQEVPVALQKKRFTGSVGEMVARYSNSLGKFIDADPGPDTAPKRPFCDAVDNVLLELILAMELYSYMKQVRKGNPVLHSCMRLFPIMVDEFPVYRQLPNRISELTYAKASDCLMRYGIQIPVSGQKKTVREVIEYFFKLQSEMLNEGQRFKMSDDGKYVEDHTDFVEPALETVSSKIIDSICDIVSLIDPLSPFESKPLCDELNSFLVQRNCSYMTRILAANGVTSLRKLSSLTLPSAILDLAKQCSAVSSKTVVNEVVALTNAIDESKVNESSWLLSARLSRFIDKDASFETVIKSSSGLLISAAQKEWLTVYFCFGIVFFILGCLSVASNGAGGTTLLNYTAFSFLMILTSSAHFHSPKRGYIIYCCSYPAMILATVIGFGFDFLRNNSIRLENSARCSAAARQLATSFDTCAVAQICCGPLLLVILLFFNFCQALWRQDLAWSTFLGSCAVYLATDALFQLFVLGEVVSNVSINFILLAAVFATSMLTEFMNLRAKKKALRIVEDDKKKYDAKWKSILSKESQSIRDLATDLTNYFGHAVESESSATLSVLQDCKDIDEMYSRAEFINDAFQSLVSGLLEFLQGAECTKQPQYSKCIFFKEFGPSKDLLQLFSQIDRDQLFGEQEDAGLTKTLNQTLDRIQNQSSTTDSNSISQTSHHLVLEVKPSHEPKQDEMLVVDVFTGAVEGHLTPVHVPDSIVEVSEPKSSVHADDTPSVLVRRGPVKLPSRAIAKVDLHCASQIVKIS